MYAARFVGYTRPIKDLSRAEGVGKLGIRTRAVKTHLDPQRNDAQRIRRREGRDKNSLVGSRKREKYFAKRAAEKPNTKITNAPRRNKGVYRS